MVINHLLNGMILQIEKGWENNGLENACFKSHDPTQLKPQWGHHERWLNRMILQVVHEPSPFSLYNSRWRLVKRCEAWRPIPCCRLKFSLGNEKQDDPDNKVKMKWVYKYNNNDNNNR